MNKATTSVRIREASELLAHMRSVQLATLCEDNTPLASYAPFVHANGALYVYLSELAQHAQNFVQRPTVCAMLIRDETDCDEIFARPRLMLNCEVVEQARGSEVFIDVLDQFALRFGETVNTIRVLSDFRLFELRPQQARLVSGFAKATRLSAQALTSILNDISFSRQD